MPLVVVVATRVPIIKPVTRKTAKKAIYKGTTLKSPWPDEDFFGFLILNFPLSFLNKKKILSDILLLKQILEAFQGIQVHQSFKEDKISSLQKYISNRSISY